MRSTCVLQLLNTKRVHSFRRVREEETIALLEKIENRSSSPMDLSEMLASLTNDVICRVAFERKYSEGERGKKFKELLKEFGALLGVFNVGDFIPWHGWVNYVSGLNGRVERNFREFDCFLDEVIDNHMGAMEEWKKKGW
ncbi:Cytochrome P450 71A22 [Camellia lanceoleosa]|uniref:Cytochrome P450 71A22 n=1 Tax=Camellia lanceoleosa TaxID=1840588 RepID=A0ACC0HJH8_9ERIC|nr:Cytochrome P450 71A22 [Camellia lanceoleosa]